MDGETWLEYTESIELNRMNRKKFLAKIEYIDNKIKTINEPINYYLGGGYNEPYIPEGFRHIGVEDWNHGYTIIGQTTSVRNEFVWVPCVLTEEEQQQAKDEGDTVQIFQMKLDYPKTNGINVTGETIEASYIETSVGKYQGFYIAKYEAGIEGTTDNYRLSTRKPTNGTYKPLSQPNVGVWNYITKNEAIRVSNVMIDYSETGAHSTLISGAAWDTTLQWITNTVDATYATNSTGKGNYSGSIAVTSSNNNTAYSKNNIYDMAGNVFEFTTEKQMYHGVLDTPLYRGRIL